MSNNITMQHYEYYANTLLLNAR